MNLSKLAEAPEYTDGYFDLYDMVDVPDENNPDFPVKKLKARKIGGRLARIWYRETQIYDRTRIAFDQASRQVTIKIRIPKWNGINSDCVCIVGGDQHRVYNAVSVISSQGYEETEITLIKPDVVYEVIE